jgi:hypothetical protein
MSYSTLRGNSPILGVLVNTAHAISAKEAELPSMNVGPALR